jgi:hypothetical protein
MVDNNNSLTEKTQSAPPQQLGGHESSDVSIAHLLQFGAGLAVLTAFTFLSIGWMFSYLEKGMARSDVQPSGLSDVEQHPPEPRLQIDPTQELKRLVEMEASLLNSYGWVDSQAGVVRIPIERAIQLLLEKGLPSREEGLSLTDRAPSLE